MKRYLQTLLILIVAQIGLRAQTAAVTADTVFNKYYQATGGKTLWDGVQTYTIKQAYRAGTANDYDLALQGSLPMQALSKTRTIMKRDFIYGIKGTDGWVKIPIGSRDKVTQFQTSDLSEKDRETMRRELRDLVAPFMDYTQKGYIATVVGPEQINGKSATQVELEGKGIKYNLFFDTASGLLVREKVTLPTGEIQTRDHSQYAKSTYGISYPSETTFVSSIDKKPVKVTTTIEFNPTIADTAFAR
jgi:putative salt-induced outer membrane protein